MIKIYTYNGISPEFVELQVSSFKKYLQEDFEFIMFNSEVLDKHSEKSKEVSKIGKSLGIQVVEAQVDADIEAATSKSLCQPRIFDNGKFLRDDQFFVYAIEWSWKRIISKERGPICIINSDVFLMEPIKLTDYLQEQPMSFIPQNPPPEDVSRFGQRLQISPQMVLIDVSKIPNPETMCWLGGSVDGCHTDVGGNTYHYLKAHPELKYLSVSVDGCYDDPAVDFHPSFYQFFNLGGKKILHYLSGSRANTEHPEALNWPKEKSDDYHRKKLAWAKKMVNL